MMNAFNALLNGEDPVSASPLRTRIDIVRRSNRHPDARVFADMLEAFADALYAGIEPPPLSDKQRRVLEGVSMHREAWELGEKFDRCRDEYLAAAQKIVGVYLGWAEAQPPLPAIALAAQLLADLGEGTIPGENAEQPMFGCRRSISCKPSGERELRIS